MSTITATTTTTTVTVMTTTMMLMMHALKMLSTVGVWNHQLQDLHWSSTLS